MYPDFQSENLRKTRTRRIARHILGVDRNAGSEDVKRAWKRKCLALHPDKNGGDERARERFKIVNCAYEILNGDEGCGEELLDYAEGNSESLSQDYETENSWGFFLWWKEKFF
jgi:preprotein translocase subunit Sec63